MIKATDLKFGIIALEKIDNHFPKQKEDGMEIGVGIQMSIANYMIGNLKDSLILWVTSGSDLSEEEVIPYVDNLDEEALNKFGNEVFDVFTKAQQVMFRMKRVEMLDLIKEARQQVLED